MSNEDDAAQSNEDACRLCPSCRDAIEAWFQKLEGTFPSNDETLVMAMQLMAAFKHSLLDGHLIGNARFVNKLRELELQHDKIIETKYGKRTRR